MLGVSPAFYARHPAACKRLWARRPALPGPQALKLTASCDESQVALMDHHYHSPMPRVLALLALLLATAAQAQTIVWDKFDPMAVRTNRAADVVIETQTSGTVSGMRL